jgi:hypothetical protein
LLLAKEKLRKCSFPPINMVNKQITAHLDRKMPQISNQKMLSPRKMG